MSPHEVYSNHAKHCRTLAQLAHTEHGRDLFIELAKRWDELVSEDKFMARLPPCPNHAKIYEADFEALSSPEH